MHVMMMGQEYFVENNAESVRQLLNQIRTTVAESGLLFSHLVVDGMEIFTDLEQYLYENLKNIERVYVHLVTPADYLLNILHTGQEYIQNAIPQLQPLVDEFYAVPDSTSWRKLGDLTEGMQWFQQTSLFMRGLKTLPEWGVDLQSALQFDAILSQLADAVNQEDAVLIGDIIQYEIIPRFETLSQLLANIPIDGVENKC